MLLFSFMYCQWLFGIPAKIVKIVLVYLPYTLQLKFSVSNFHCMVGQWLVTIFNHPLFYSTRKMYNVLEHINMNFYRAHHFLQRWPFVTSATLESDEGISAATTVAITSTLSIIYLWASAFPYGVCLKSLAHTTRKECFLSFLVHSLLYKFIFVSRIVRSRTVQRRDCTMKVSPANRSYLFINTCDESQ